MAPFPCYPHINTFQIGSMIVQPHVFSLESCSEVMGWSHIIVFIAGQTIKGLFNLFYIPFQRQCSWNQYEMTCVFMSQQRHTSVIRLSHIPVDNLARVLALKGAMIIASAHFLSYICNTGSPLFFHNLYSSSSQQIQIPRLLTQFLISQWMNFMALIKSEHTL